ncbi:MAG TPA: L-2-hydroxyglutarate oxidase [Anaeromyxobacteraceae bacterium]|nr:L-2-hydroxyglutarate oxidase [Anaeromyxobacteraceae bacterium]
MVPDRAEVLVVGGGIVGLTLARELVLAGRGEVVVLEKEPELGRHASGRNSGVLHAGVYYAEGTLKARSCLAGNRLMRAYCRQKGLPVLETGKVIVARSEEELPALEELHRRATANGARVEMVDERSLADIEPLARTAGRALFSADTAVVDPKAVLQALAADLAGSGRCRLVTECRFLGLAAPGVAETSLGRVAFRRLVNAAGAHCDAVARAFGLAGHYRLIPFKGIYRQLRAGRDYPVRGNIYPVPDVRNPFLGIHFTRGAHGEVTLGPTAIPALGRENYGLLRGIDRGGPAIVLADAALFLKNPRFREVALTEPRKYLPGAFARDAARLVKRFDPADFERSPKVGIRAQLVDWRTKELVMDFLVEARDESVHVLNPISPAFTASMEIARTVVREHF